MTFSLVIRATAPKSIVDSQAQSAGSIPVTHSTTKAQVSDPGLHLPRDARHARSLRRRGYGSGAGLFGRFLDLTMRWDPRRVPAGARPGVFPTLQSVASGLLGAVRLVDTRSHAAAVTH
ncbi:hypothetical protein [Streptomyces sparsogenes]|uniref:hypothetical protein n=1 Tax=Streptomyces sparsogenes TaxID=67365 RepID=UPI00341024DA